MQPSERDASQCGTAASSCIPLVLTLVAACVAPVGLQVHRAPPPSETERYCAWFGAASGQVLYFGEAAFWSAYGISGGEPRADLREPGPRRIGRFDLDRKEFLAPLDVGGLQSRSGVWDVLPVGERVYFTTYFEEAGYVEPATGRVVIFADARFFNELSAGPDGRILVSRYADEAGGGGAVLELGVNGEVLAEHVLESPAGVAYAAKSPAWDPVTDEIWVTTDRLPLPDDGPGAPFPRPTIVLDRSGREIARVGTSEDPVEIQFVRFDADGRGYLAVSSGGSLELVLLSPDDDRRDWAAARRVLLDDHFPAGLDFAQDIQPGAAGAVWVTRWSGRIHRVTAGGSVRTWALPHPEGSLYYTAVPTRSGLCATRCGDVEVVCASDADAEPRSGP